MIAMTVGKLKHDRTGIKQNYQWNKINTLWNERRGRKSKREKQLTIVKLWNPLLDPSSKLWSS